MSALYISQTRGPLYSPFDVEVVLPQGIFDGVIGQFRSDFVTNDQSHLFKADDRSFALGRIQRAQMLTCWLRANLVARWTSPLPRHPTKHHR
jgi:hypothetical protein